MILPFPLPNAVTLDVRAAPLEQALPEVGRAFGVSMRAAPAIGEEIAVFALRGADLEGFKAWTAKTFAAEWSVERDGSLYLNRSPRLRDAETKRLGEERAERVRRWRAERTSEAQIAQGFDALAARTLRRDMEAHLARPSQRETRVADVQRKRRLEARFPGKRMYAQVAAAFPAEAFVSPGAPERIVYSSQPVGRQRALPFDPAPILRSYVREANLWAEATADLPPSTTVPGGRIPILIGRRQEPVPEAALMVVSMNFRYSATGSMEVALYDAGGRRLVRESGFVGEQEVTDDVQRSAARHATEFPLKLSEESKRFAAVHFPREGETPSLEAVRPFLDVRKRDPLSYGASDGLFSLADARGKSLVARAGDDLAWVFRQREDGKTNVALLNYFEYGVREEGAWLAVVPDDPEREAMQTLSRALLAQMLRIAESTGLRTIEDAAGIAALFPDHEGSYDLSRLYAGVFPQWPRFNLAGLALYGRLSEAERRRARTAEGLPLVGLNREARSTLERTIFLRRDLWFVPRSPADETERHRVERGTWGEPTILFASGLPADGRVRLGDASVDAVRYGEGSWSPILTAEEYALAEDRAANPGRYPEEDTSPLEKGALFPLVQRRLTMEIRTSRLTAESHTFTSEEFEPGGPFTPQTLPARWREANARAVAALAQKNRDLPAAPATSGSQVPPPR